MLRRRLDAAPHSRDRWLLSYADFITLLLAVFVVLFASSQPDKGKARRVSYAVKEALENGRAMSGNPAAVHRIGAHRIPSAAAITEPRAAVPELMPSINRLTQALAAEISTGRVEVHLEAKGLVISLRQAAFFPSGGDVIAASGFGSLEKIARIIRDLPNPVRLEGHTDSAPVHTRRFRSNWELSTARSIAMLELFEGRYGIPGSRFAVSGYAETKPVDSNDSAEGRAHNRRVDIVILNY
jgi:chemotaxis protein MotB